MRNMDAKRKKKIWKITAWTVGVLVVLILAVLLSLGVIVKSAITTIGPKALGAPVTVGSVSINVFSGVVDIRDLFVGNPEGFQNDRALTVKQMRIDVQPSSFFGKKLVVEEFTLTGVDVYFEVSASKLSNNLSQLNANIAEFSGSAEKAEAEPEEGEQEAAPKEKEDLRLQVNDLNLTSIFVNVVASAPGLPVTNAPIPIVPIELDALGQDEEGITALKLTAVILNKLTLGVLSAVGEAFPSMKDITDAGANVLNTVDGLVRDFGNLLKAGKKK